MRYRTVLASICAVAVAVAMASGCGGSKPKTTGGGGGDTTGGGGGDHTRLDPNAGKPKPKTLYDRLGGKPAVDAVVDEFVNRTTTDPRIMNRFFNTDADNLKRLLSEFVCYATGGGCTYTGRDMTTAHAGMDLVDDEFNALVENLSGALDKFNVAPADKNELLGALGPLKPQIVVDPATLHPIDAEQLAKVTAVADKVEDKGAKDLLAAAVVAGQRGQRSYAEQLFTRAEMITGPKPVASVANVFRAGAPPRVTTALKTMPADSPAQPATVGNSDDDQPEQKPAKGKLTGTLKVDGASLSGMGVVMLTPKGGGGKKRVAKERVIEQRDKKFAPHLMAVPVGSTVSFPNFDAIFHNVFSLSKPKAFDLGMFKGGETREVKFDKPGIIRLGCNIHASMSAYLIVVSAPHYAVVGDDGSFAFKSLKPGKYKVEAWSEQSAEPTTSELTIKEGENTVALDIKGGATQGPGDDKFGQSRSQTAEK